MRPALLALAALALGVAAPAPVRADPPFTTIEVRAGDVSFSRLYNVRVVSSSDPAIATVEAVAATSELHITGKAVGRPHVVAFTSGRLIGIRVLVRDGGKAAPGPTVDPEALLVAAKKACPGLRVTGEGPDALLDVPPPNAGCRAALMPLLASGHWTVPKTHVSFDPETLSLQLVQVEAALKAAGVTGLQVRYQGAQMMLVGHLSRADAARAAVAVYHSTVGGLPVNDGDLELDGEEDGGF